MKQLKYNNIKALVILLLPVCLFMGSLLADARVQQGNHVVDVDQRSFPSNYDPGPAKGSSWARLFGETPNYRELGKTIIGGSKEKFRWNFGPMWYRGRLGKNEVQAFVVGQEGAQDENVSNRAFTGSTGTKTQKFLNHLGLRRSYLFLNTFVYTINGQLSDDPKFEWMEQNTDSPIVQYRHRLFDNVAAMNPDSLALLLGVGTGGKRSLTTWIQANGGTDCRYVSEDPATCPTEKFRKAMGLKKKIVAIGVPHPGGASPSNGGLSALRNIISKFSIVAENVGKEVEKDLEDGKLDWIIPDADANTDDSEELARQLARRMKREFDYGNASVPFYDFAFGTNWRMGAEGTTSNRRGADTIQVFSDNGRYNNDGHTLKYSTPKDYQNLGMRTSSGQTKLGEMREDDLAYESPRYYSDEPDFVDQYDNGPCGTKGDADNTPLTNCELSKLLQSWPNFYAESVKPISAPSFGTGPAYRGNPQSPTLIIIADQQSNDDFFSTRALTGTAGQQLQTYLASLGAGRNYFILRTLPVDTLGMSAGDVEEIALRDEVVAVHTAIVNELITREAGDRPDARKANTKAILAIGPVAKKLAERVRSELGLKLPMFDLPLLTESDHVNDYKALAPKIAAAAGFDLGRTYDGELTLIAREDLPAHTRWWMGSSGDRVRRGDKKEERGYETNGDYYKAFAPKWVSKLRSVPLSQDMKDYLESVMRGIGAGGRSLLWTSPGLEGFDLDLEFADFGCGIVELESQEPNPELALLGSDDNSSIDPALSEDSACSFTLQ